jgi:hypothetical protein
VELFGEDWLEWELGQATENTAVVGGCSNDADCPNLAEEKSAVNDSDASAAGAAQGFSAFPKGKRND